tara:strand:+ start:16363 stop:16764 length:402 start_codon:yes stop_codon:yes gene_type:complete
MGGRFLAVLRFITHTPKIRNKVASTDVPMPTRGQALPSVARSHWARSCRSLRLKVQRAAERLLSQTVDLTSQPQQTTAFRAWYRSIRTALTGHSIADTTLRCGFRISAPHTSRRILQSAVPDVWLALKSRPKR